MKTDNPEVDKAFTAYHLCSHAYSVDLSFNLFFFLLAISCKLFFIISEDSSDTDREMVAPEG